MTNRFSWINKGLALAVMEDAISMALMAKQLTAATERAERAEAALKESRKKIPLPGVRRGNKR